MRLVHCDRCNAGITDAPMRYTLHVTEHDMSLGVETQKDARASDLCLACAHHVVEQARDPALPPYPANASPINYVWRDGDWRRYQ